MRTRLLWILALLVCATVPAYGREKAFGICTQQSPLLADSNATPHTGIKVQQVSPSCTITVYITGTLTPATLYADNIGTPKSNPFTADTNGLWFFYADNGRYDVRFSGGAPTVSPAYTYSDYLLCDGCGGVGGGGVSSVGLAGPIGILISGSPVTSSGTLVWSMPTGWTTGDLLVGNGPNSVTRLPIGPSGFFLGSNGTTELWQAIPATTCPAGTNTDVQFNDSGVCGGVAQLTYDKIAQVFTAPQVDVNGSAAGSVNIFDSSHVNSVNVTVPSSVTTYTVKLPATQGTTNQVLGISGVVGSVVSTAWQTLAAGCAAPTDTQVVYSHLGSCAGSALLTWDYSDEIFMAGNQPSPNGQPGQIGSTPFNSFFTAGSTGTFWEDAPMEAGNITDSTSWVAGLAVAQQNSINSKQTYGGRFVNVNFGNGGSANTFGIWAESWAAPASGTAHDSIAAWLQPSVAGAGTVSNVIGAFIEPTFPSGVTATATNMIGIDIDGVVGTSSTAHVTEYAGLFITVPGLSSSSNDSATNDAAGICIMCAQGSGAEAGRFAIDVGANGGAALFRNTSVIGNFVGSAGSFSYTGVGSDTLAPTAMSNAGAPTVTTNNSGATTWSYKIVAVAGSTTSAASTAGSVSGGTTLDVTHFNTITCAGTVAGATSYDVYRTVVGTSPNTTGKIGSLNADCKVFSGGVEVNLVDNGLAGDSSTAPATNTTGQIILGAPVLNATGFSFPSVLGCGTTTTCSNSAPATPRVVYGSVALNNASPSIATIASISPAFTSSSTYVCTATDQTTATNNLLKVTNVSGSSFTITGPNTTTDVVAYHCIGN